MRSCIRDANFTVSKGDFKGEEFNTLMASGKGKRLWVSYCDGAHYFKVETIKNGDGVVCETFSFNEAIKVFNELNNSDN